MNYPNMGSYNQQLQQVQNQLMNLQNQNWWLNPQQAANTLPVREPEQIKSVTGIDGAKTYLQNMPPNSSAILLDNNDNIFYSVKKDVNGIAFPVVIGHFTLETEQQQTANYVTYTDFENFKTELKQMLEDKK